MATTDFDGTNLMILGEGTQVALVIGEQSYRGTLQMRKTGVQKDWYIKLEAVEPGAPDEIAIVKRQGAVDIVVKPNTTGEIVAALDEIHEITKPKD